MDKNYLSTYTIIYKEEIDNSIQTILSEYWSYNGEIFPTKPKKLAKVNSISMHSLLTTIKTNSHAIIQHPCSDCNAEITLKVFSQTNFLHAITKNELCKECLLKQRKKLDAENLLKHKEWVKDQEIRESKKKLSQNLNKAVEDFLSAQLSMKDINFMLHVIETCSTDISLNYYNKHYLNFNN